MCAKANNLNIDILDSTTRWTIVIHDADVSYTYYHKKPLDKNGDVDNTKVDEIIAKVKKQYLIDKKKNSNND